MMFVGYTAVLQQSRGMLLCKKNIQSLFELGLPWARTVFLSKSIKSTTWTLATSVCLLPRDDEPWYQQWRDFSQSTFLGEGIKTNPEEKLLPCWRGDLCCKSDVLSLNVSHNRGLTNVLCWKWEGCLSVSYRTFWTTFCFAAPLFFG